MPMRQIRKQQSHKKYKHQRGGDTGRYVLPPAYFGKGTSGYYPDGSTELKTHGAQHAVSHGVISSDGKWAGPNLFPMMGGDCGCKKLQRGGMHPTKKAFKPTIAHQKGGMHPTKKSLKHKKLLKHKKSKSRKH